MVDTFIWYKTLSRMVYGQVQKIFFVLVVRGRALEVPWDSNLDSTKKWKVLGYSSGTWILRHPSFSCTRTPFFQCENSFCFNIYVPRVCYFVKDIVWVWIARSTSWHEVTWLHVRFTFGLNFWNVYSWKPNWKSVPNKTVDHNIFVVVFVFVEEIKNK